MKKKILLIIFLITHFVFYPQQNNSYIKEWATYFGGQGISLTNCNLDTQGNIIALGTISTSLYPPIKSDINYFNSFTVNAEDSNLYQTNSKSILVKINPEGIILKTIYFPFIPINFYIDLSNNIFLSAVTELDTLGTENVWFSNAVDDNNKTIILKLNSNFEKSWCTYIPVEDLGQIIIDEENNIYGIGSTKTRENITTPGVFQESFITQVSNYGYFPNGLLFKLNADGQLIWSTYYGVGVKGNSITHLNNEIITSFHINDDNIFNFPQYIQSFITTDALQSSVSNSILSKFNKESGIRTYSSFFGNDSYVSHLTTDGFNIYMLAQQSQNLTNNLLLQNSFQTNFGGYFDLYLAKFTMNFQPIWGTYIGGQDFESFIPNSKLIFKSNALYLVGETESSQIAGITQFYQNNNAGATDLFVMKYDTNGSLIWGSFFGGSMQEYEGDILPINDSEFYLVGNTYSQNNIATSNVYQENLNFHPNYFNLNFGNGFVAKFSPDPQLSVPKINEYPFIIYPNPTNGQSINIKGNLKSNYSVELFSILGQKISSYKLNNTLSHNLNLNKLSPGTYFLKITNGNFVLQTNKIVVN